MIELVKADIKLRYSSSVLGFLWVFLKPFFTFLVIISVFSYFFNQHDSHYRFNVLFGLIFFNYFVEGTIRGLTSLFDKSTLILKTRFPRYLIVVVSVLDSLVNFLAMLIVFIVLWFFLRNDGSVTISFEGLAIFAVAAVAITALIISFSFFVSILFVKLRDLNSIWGLTTQILMYLTPIIYPLNVLPQAMQKIFIFNPLTIIIDYSRNAMLGLESAVPANYFAIVVTASIASVFFSFSYFKRNIGKIAEFL